VLQYLSMVLSTDGSPLRQQSDASVSIFRHGDNDDHAEEDRQLERARAEWGRIGRILLVSTRGANPIMMGSFYKVIVQYVLLYHGSESWKVKTLTDYQSSAQFASSHEWQVRLKVILPRYLLQADLIILECR